MVKIPGHNQDILGKKDLEESDDQDKSYLIRIMIVLPLSLLTMFIHNPNIQFVVSVGILFFCGKDFLSGLARFFYTGKWDANTLIGLGILGPFIYHTYLFILFLKGIHNESIPFAITGVCIFFVLLGRCIISLMTEKTRTHQEAFYSFHNDVFSVHKMAMQRSMDRLSIVFMSLILVSAVLSFLFWLLEDMGIAIYVMSAVILISSPDAFGWSVFTPLDTVMARLMGKNIIIRNGEVLERVGRFALEGDDIHGEHGQGSKSLRIGVGDWNQMDLPKYDIIVPKAENLGEVLLLSRRAFSVVQQNLFFALIYNVVGIALATGLFFPGLFNSQGQTGMGLAIIPVLACCAAIVSDLIVSLNSLRLFRPRL